MRRGDAFDGDGLVMARIPGFAGGFLNLFGLPNEGLLGNVFDVFLGSKVNPSLLS